MDIKTVAYTFGQDDGRYLVLAMQTLKGCAGDWVRRHFQANQNTTWADFKDAIKLRFCPTTITHAEITKAKTTTE